MVQSLATDDSRINVLIHEMERLVRFGEIVETNLSGTRVKVEIQATYDEGDAPATAEIVDCIYMCPPYGRKAAIHFRPTARRTLREGDLEIPTQGEFGFVITPYRSSFSVFLGGMRTSPTSSVDIFELLRDSIVGPVARPSGIGEDPALFIGAEDDAESPTPTRGVFVGSSGLEGSLFMKLRADAILVSMRNTLGKLIGQIQEFVLPIINTDRMQFRTSHSTHAQERGGRPADDWSDTARVPVAEITIPLPPPANPITITTASAEIDMQTSQYAFLLENVEIEARTTGGAWVGVSPSPEFFSTVTRYTIPLPTDRTGIRMRPKTFGNFTEADGGPAIQLVTNTLDSDGNVVRTFMNLAPASLNAVNVLSGPFSPDIRRRNFSIITRKAKESVYVEQEYVFVITEAR